ncbi:MAG: glycosyltransferase family 2 protein [Candidatus Shapirobacteria bacterium]|nr:glycosyltransferase family 2 protein [Candidatus Shapirobacteria bacterium]
MKQSSLGMISLIIPIYNGENFIRNCFNSVFQQTYSNWEIIVVNDGSVDNTKKILDEYVTNKKIIIIESKNNGPAAARNLALSKAKGEWIFFLDIDDSLEKRALEILIDNNNENEYDYIIGNFIRLKGGFEEKRNDIIFNKKTKLTVKNLVSYARNYLKRPNKYLLFSFLWGRLYRKEILDKYHLKFYEDLYTFEDLTFNYAYLKRIRNALYLSEIVYHYTIHENYQSATMIFDDKPERLFGFYKALVNIKTYLKKYIGEGKAEAEVGHADIFLTIIQLVRLCGQINGKNWREIYKLVGKLVDMSILRRDLRFYIPMSGDSKIVPLLIRWRLVWPLIIICKYKAFKRYNKVGVKL